MSDITLTDKMNEMIKDFLRQSKDPFKLYILARIEQLEAENSAIHAQTDPSVAANKMVDDNPPLTLEELREMDGEPVWLEPAQQWRIVYADRDRGFVRLYTVFNIISAKHALNDDGRIYRRKPEEKK